MMMDIYVNFYVLLVEFGMNELLFSLCVLVVVGIVCSYWCGIVLIEEGLQGDSFYLILIGSLCVYVCDVWGWEIIYGVYGLGEYVGEMSLDGGLCLVSVIIEVVMCCVIVLCISLFVYIFVYLEFVLELFIKVICCVCVVMLFIKQLVLNDVYGWLKMLLQQEMQIGEELVFMYQVMVQCLGCLCEMVFKLIKDLEVGQYLLCVMNGCYCCLKDFFVWW